MSDPARGDGISSTEEIIEDARNGRIFILVDHEDRENEGDLIMPGQMAGPAAINFMVTHGRGLVCLALTPERVDALGLKTLSPKNRSRGDTAFTVSIEAREGVTTGVSVHDRARTVAVAVDPTSGPGDITLPGHVFPLRAREGGVLTRAGHTEAAVDIARLAGLNPSGVICEIMNEDGSMARLPDLVTFASRHDIRIGTIADLIAYRLRNETMVDEVICRAYRSAAGCEWVLRVFLDRVTGGEHLALTLGDLSGSGSVLVRVHAVDMLDDLLGFDPARAARVPRAMARIEAEGAGALLMVRDMNPEGDLHPSERRGSGVGQAPDAPPVRGRCRHPQGAGSAGDHPADGFTASPDRRDQRLWIVCGRGRAVGGGKRRWLISPASCSSSPPITATSPTAWWRVRRGISNRKGWRQHWSRCQGYWKFHLPSAGFMT